MFSNKLTVFVSGEVGLSLVTGPGLARLVDRDYPELVPLALAQARHSRLQLVDCCCAVLVVSDESVKPAAELVFLLNDIVRDGAATVLLGLVPSQRD